MTTTATRIDDDIDSHVAAIFDINVAATHCIRLRCEDCAGLSILPVPGPGVDEERPWLCPVCGPGFEADLREWFAARRHQVEE